MRRSFGLWCVVAALGAGVSWIAYRSIGGEAAPRAAPGAASASRLDHDAAAAQPSELAELRRALVDLRRQVAAQGQQAGSGNEPPRPRDPRIDPEAREEYERAHREAIAGVDAAFRSEAVDPQWSSEASSAIQAAITADDKLRLLARGIECRSRTCRLEIADDGAGDLDKSLPELTLRIGQDLHSAVYDRVQGGDGVSRRVLYLSHASTSGTSRTTLR